MSIVVFELFSPQDHQNKQMAKAASTQGAIQLSAFTA
jgi:hypothetical protein